MAKKYIYKDQKDWDHNAESADQNGCTQEFLDEYYNGDLEAWLNDNKTNTFCFNCYSCTNCESCDWCTNCENCDTIGHCTNCEKCKSCYGGDELIECDKCQYCIKCIQSDHCEYCIDCEKCTECVYCKKCDDCFQCDLCYNCWGIESEATCIQDAMPNNTTYPREDFIKEIENILNIKED